MAYLVLNALWYRYLIAVKVQHRIRIGRHRPMKREALATWHNFHAWQGNPSHTGHISPIVRSHSMGLYGRVRQTGGSGSGIPEKSESRVRKGLKSR